MLINKRGKQSRFCVKGENMKIGGFMKQSFVDFPGTICAVIFTDGCNLNCWYCHNRQLIAGNSKTNYSLEQIYAFLESRKSFLDGVVISGGEPTLQVDLIDVIQHLKAMGFKVKLDTNGTNPNVLLHALQFVDFIAMDVKNSLQNYCKTVGQVDIAAIKQSIEILKNCGKDYEFRLTFAPDVSLADVQEIGRLVQGAQRFALQTYNPQSNLWPHQPPENYQKALQILKKYVFNAFTR